MAFPKKRYNPNINPVRIGNEYMKYGMDRVNDLLEESDPRSKYIPRTIMLEDLDQATFDFVNGEDLKFVIDGTKVPCFYMDNDRWGEYSKTWKFTDQDKNVPTPYILVRRSEKQKGTRLGGKNNVPQLRKFRYYNLPINDNGQVIYLIFKTPEPTNIDLIYEITLITKFRVDVNYFDETFFKKFASIQSFVFPKGTPMALLFDSVTESNPIENIDGDKFFTSKFTIKLQGFIQDENDFEITKTTRKPNFGFFIDN